MPWVSTPRRSAATRHLATMAALDGETPLAMRTDVAKAVASEAVTRTTLFVVWGKAVDGWAIVLAVLVM